MPGPYRYEAASYSSRTIVLETDQAQPLSMTVGFMSSIFERPQRLRPDPIFDLGEEVQCFLNENGKAKKVTGLVSGNIWKPAEKTYYYDIENDDGVKIAISIKEKDLAAVS